MEEWSPVQEVLNVLIRKLEHEKQDPKVITARLNFAIALFQAMVPQFCGMNIPEEAAVRGNVNSVHDLLECIAIVACNKSEENYNPLAVFGEAAFQDPVQFVKDLLGGGFALGTLIEMAGPTVVGLAQQVPSALFQIGKYMVTNPLTSFTTYQVTLPYVQSLLQKVFGDRFGVQDQWDEDMRRLFDELSEHYMREGVTDIIGFPPADIDSVRNRLNQILYQIGSRTIASLQSTAGIVDAAKRFPAELCQRLMSAGTAINRWLCANGMRLLERYKFIPQGTEEGLFERILRELDRKGLRENQHIDVFVIAYLKHNQPTTVFHESFEYFMAEQVMKYGPLLPPGDISSSQEAQASPVARGSKTIETVGPKEGSGLLLDSGNTHADVIWPNGDGSDLGDFRLRMQPRRLQDAITQDALGSRRVQGSSQAQCGNPSFPSSSGAAQSFRPSVRRDNEFSLPLGTGTGPNLSSSFSQGGLGGPAQPRSAKGGLGGHPGGSASGLGGFGGFGGRSRSRKRSVSKRTRRKGLAKKQNSNKNKLQSRRKVHRASSRRSHK